MGREAAEEIKKIIDEELEEKKKKVIDMVWHDISSFFDSKLPDYLHYYNRVLKIRNRAVRKWLPMLETCVRGGFLDYHRFTVLASALLALSYLRRPYAPPMELFFTDTREYIVRATRGVFDASYYVNRKGKTLTAILDVLDPMKVSTGPISYDIMLAFAWARLYGGDNLALATNGRRIVVAGELGSGKTTLTFLHLAAVLYQMGASPETIKNYAREYMVNNIRDYAAVVYVASTYTIEQGVLVPAIIFDDAAVVLSKYTTWLPGSTSKKERKIATVLTKQLQISREGIGLVGFITSNVQNIAKGIRDTLDQSIIGINVKQTTGNTTVWITTSNKYFLTDALKSYFSPGKIIKRIHYGIVENAGVTRIPPTFMPTDLYIELQTKKVETRRQITEELIHYGESREEEEPEEELEEGVIEEEATRIVKDLDDLEQ